MTAAAQVVPVLNLCMLLLFLDYMRYFSMILLQIDAPFNTFVVECT